jgi:hypothetical protein
MYGIESKNNTGSDEQYIDCIKFPSEEAKDIFAYHSRCNAAISEELANSINDAIESIRLKSAILWDDINNIENLLLRSKESYEFGNLRYISIAKANLESASMFAIKAISRIK